MISESQVRSVGKKKKWQRVPEFTTENESGDISNFCNNKLDIIGVRIKDFCFLKVHEH